MTLVSNWSFDFVAGSFWGMCNDSSAPTGLEHAAADHDAGI